MPLEILPDKQAVATRAAELLSQQANTFAANLPPDAQSANEDNLRFNIALAGGTTPKLLYQLLAAPPYQTRLPWKNIHWFFGDERDVTHDHPDSNFRMAKESLFDPAEVPPPCQFPVPLTGESTPELAAATYNDLLMHFLRGQVDSNEAHSFNLLLLGMGADGHTASLFPHTAALHGDEKLVVANYVEKLKVWRITVTPPLINVADHILVLVTGKEKAPALAAVLEGDMDVNQYPAQILRDLKQVTWLVDETAASALHTD